MTLEDASGRSLPASVETFNAWELDVQTAADQARDAFKSSFHKEIAVYYALAAATIAVTKDGLSVPKDVSESQSRRIGLIGQVLINLGDAYDALTQGFYGNASASIRRFYEHLTSTKAWRIDPQKMEGARAKMKKGDRKAASLGSVQHTAKTRHEWVSLYGALSSAVHPEGLLDAISQLPLTGDLATFLVLPRFQHDFSLSLFKTLITEVAWMSEEVFALQIEFGTQELTREHQALAGGAVDMAIELGLLKFELETKPKTDQ